MFEVRNKWSLDYDYDGRDTNHSSNGYNNGYLIIILTF